MARASENKAPDSISSAIFPKTIEEEPFLCSFKTLKARKSGRPEPIRVASCLVITMSSLRFIFGVPNEKLKPALFVFFFSFVVV